MKEIKNEELQHVTGGVGPLVAVGLVAGAYALGWIGGYAKTKYEQAQKEQTAAGCSPTC